MFSNLNFHIECTLKCCPQFFNLDKSKILSSGNGLNAYKTLWEKENFLLFTQCFSEVLLLRVIETCDCLVEAEPFPKQALVFTCLQYTTFENTAGKGEIAQNEQFLLFPQCFLSVWRNSCHFHQI